MGMISTEDLTCHVAANLKNPFQGGCAHIYVTRNQSHMLSLYFGSQITRFNVGNLCACDRTFSKTLKSPFQPETTINLDSKDVQFRFVFFVFEILWHVREN